MAGTRRNARPHIDENLIKGTLERLDVDDILGKTETDGTDKTMAAVRPTNEQAGGKPASQLLLDMISLVSDIKSTSEQPTADQDRQREKKKQRNASKAERTMTIATRIIGEHGYNVELLTDGRIRDIDGLARDMEAFRRECIHARDWELAHEANAMLSQLTLVETGPWQ